MTDKPPFRPGELVVGEIEPSMKLVVDSCVWIESQGFGFDSYWLVYATDLMEIDDRRISECGPASSYVRYSVEW